MKHIFVSQPFGRPVCGALVKADAPKEVKLLIDVDDAGKTDTFDTDNEFFRAPMIAIYPGRQYEDTGEDSPTLMQCRPVWAIHGNVIVEAQLTEPMIAAIWRSREDNKLPTYFSYQKPYTMPNGESFSGVAS